MRRLIPLLVLVIACNEYDLTRDADEEGGDDTAPPLIDEDAPAIAVSPENLDFGFVPWGCESAGQDLTVSNVGAADLEVTRIQISTDVYSIAGDPDLEAEPLLLAPGEEKVYTVYFSPSEDASLAGQILFDSTAGQEGAEVVGDGADEGFYEETFTQTPHGEVDVLWVIDNSGSMSDVLSTVGENFEAFIGPFLDLGLDFHLGVVTTDMDNPDQSGKLIGGYIDSSSADPEDAFLDAVDQGSSGSGSERGLEAVYTALTDPLTSSDNAGFFRDDAALATIIVSDEDDDSDLDSDEFSDWYNGLKADPSDATFSAICGDASTGWLDPGGCIQWSWPPVSAEAGTEYVEAVDATGGAWASICSEDFESTLDHLATHALGYTDCFELTGEPADGVSSFEYVTVDGDSVSYSSVNGWTYDEDRNCIQFNGDAVPLGEAEIDVGYTIDGGCG